MKQIPLRQSDQSDCNGGQIACHNRCKIKLDEWLCEERRDCVVEDAYSSSNEQLAEACSVARAGRSAIYQAISEGSLLARKRGRRTLILAADLESWVQKLPAVQPKIRSKP